MTERENGGYQPEREHPANKLTEQTIADLRGTKSDPRLDDLKRIYAEGNDGALVEALMLCWKEGIQLPEWVFRGAMHATIDAVMGENARAHGKGPGSRWVSRQKHDLKDLLRYNAVLAGLDEGVEWVDVYAWASCRLIGTEGSKDAIEKAYKRVVQRKRESPGRYAVFKHVPSPRFFRNSDFS